MACELNTKAVERCRYLIDAGEVEHIEGNWEDDKATHDEIVKFLNSHTLEEYGQWFLGVDKQREGKDRYCYPIGDLKVVYRSALDDAIRVAGDKGDNVIRKAALELLEYLEKKGR